MAADRMRRVNEALREVLSARLAAGLKDPRIGFVTVTAVETSPDLRHAKVFVSMLGSDEERAETLAGLASSRGFLQAQIASQVRLKRTPTLEFEPDAALERGMRISRLIGDLSPDAEDDAGSSEQGSEDDPEDGDR